MPHPLHQIPIIGPTVLHFSIYIIDINVASESWSSSTPRTIGSSLMITVVVLLSSWFTKVCWRNDTKASISSYVLMAPRLARTTLGKILVSDGSEEGEGRNRVAQVMKELTP